MKRSARGHALYVLLLAMAALAVSAGVVTQRALVTLRGDHGAERRAQALWLARSAALNGAPGRREVRVDGRKAQLVVSRAAGGGTRAEVALDGFVARVEVPRAKAKLPAEDWTETYERLPPAR